MPHHLYGVAYERYSISELGQRRGMWEIVCYLGDEHMHTKLSIIVNGEMRISLSF